MKSLDGDHETYRHFRESGKHAVWMRLLIVGLCLLLVALVLTGAK